MISPLTGIWPNGWKLSPYGNPVAVIGSPDNEGMKKQIEGLLRRVSALEAEIETIKNKYELDGTASHN